MKTLTNHAGEIKRVSDEKADQEIKRGWKFSPKHLWKKRVRDINKRSIEETPLVLEGVTQVFDKDNIGNRIYKEKHDQK